jgi:glycosyltransferase involved in cell wall biosynthesis
VVPDGQVIFMMGAREGETLVVADAKIVAAATRNPLDVGTFSGLSRNLFLHLQDLGVGLVPVSTREIRPLDLLTGAVNIRGLARGEMRGRRAPKVNPNWYWSRRGSERMGRRFDARLEALTDVAADAPIVQIGTHVRTRLPGRRLFCVTDATVAQAVAADEFAVARAQRSVIDQAIECQRDVFFSCEKVFVLSEWARQSVCVDYGYPADRVIVLGAGANLSERRPRTPDHDNPYVLFVGADWEQKGGPLLLEAFRRVRAVLSTARLIVVGCRPEVDEPGVVVVGRLDRRVPSERQRLLELYFGASAFAILPRFDAFPNVLLEAAWCGVPVVSTDEGSRSEVVLDGVTGLLAPERDPQQVAERLLSVLTDRAYAKQLGEAAAARVRADFTWPVVAQRLAREIGVVPAHEKPVV